MRMYAMTPTWYFSTRYWFNTLDFVIVVIGFVGSLIEIVLIYTKCAEGNVRKRKEQSFKTLLNLKFQSRRFFHRRLRFTIIL